MLTIGKCFPETLSATQRLEHLLHEALFLLRLRRGLLLRWPRLQCWLRTRRLPAGDWLRRRNSSAVQILSAGRKVRSGAAAVRWLEVPRRASALQIGALVGSALTRRLSSPTLVQPGHTRLGWELTVQSGGVHWCPRLSGVLAGLDICRRFSFAVVVGSGGNVPSLAVVQLHPIVLAVLHLTSAL